MRRLLFASLLGALCVLMGCEADPDTMGTYTLEELEYFAEIAFGGEFSGTPFIHKWVGDVDVRLEGAYTEEDAAELQRVLAELGDLTGLRVRLTTSTTAQMAVYYVSRDSMQVVLPQYTPGNDGYVYVTWNAGGALQRATVTIDRAVAPRFRRHLVREEVTQGFGLLQDSYRYPESIFQQDYTDVTKYAPIDRTVIRMLYEPEVRPGMDEAQAMAVLRAR